MADATWEVRLQAVDATGAGVSGLRVRGFDQDRGRAPDPVGETTTDPDGRAVLAFGTAAIGGKGEGRPEFFVLVDDAGALVHQSRPTSLSPGSHDLGPLPIVRGRAASTDATPPTSAGRPSPSPNDPSAPARSDRPHGASTRDVVAPRSPFHGGPFGRLFRKLPPWTPPGADDAAKQDAVRAIASRMVEPDGPPDDPAGDNDAIPVGYTYFGQFVDHDVTFDPVSSLARLNDPDRLVNFRTPRFDLDNVYGEGPDDEPFLYDRRPEQAGGFLIGRASSPREADLPRNEQETALIGDPRNDENVIVSQLQLSFLLLHNRVLARVKAEEGLVGREAFLRAQTLVRWHYQWVVLTDYLPRICGSDTMSKVLPRRADGSGFDVRLSFYGFKEGPFMPVEFSAAAYRFGHSQVRERYALNDVVSVPVFLPPERNPGVLADLRGFRRLPGLWSVDWRRFLPIDGASRTQPSRRIDTRLSRALSSMPAGAGATKGSSLAALNLLRGFRLALPSGQAVARAMGERPLPNDELGLDPAVAGSEAPLWFYVLKEAELLVQGRHLGPVGGRIVAETLVGLAKADPNGFLSAEPSWTPARAFGAGGPLDASGDRIDLAGLLRAAGQGGDPFAR